MNLKNCNLMNISKHPTTLQQCEVEHPKMHEDKKPRNSIKLKYKIDPQEKTKN